MNPFANRIGNPLKPLFTLFNGMHIKTNLACYC